MTAEEFQARLDAIEADAAAGRITPAQREAAIRELNAAAQTGYDAPRDDTDPADPDFEGDDGTDEMIGGFESGILDD